MAEEQKGSKEESKNDDLAEKAIIKESKNTNDSKAEGLDEKVEFSGVNQDDALVTESIDVIQDATSDTTETEKEPEPSGKDLKQSEKSVKEGEKPTENTEKLADKTENQTAEKTATESSNAAENKAEIGQNQSDSDSKGTNTAVKANTEEYEDFAEEEDDEEAKADNVDDALTEDSEDESASERDTIPKKDYEKLGKEELIKEFRYLLSKYKVQAIKEPVNEIRSVFISQFEEEQDEAKEKFLEEGGNIIDFRYYSPLKKEFNTLYFEYRDKRNNYYQGLKKDLNANLENRNALIEELKDLKDEVGGEDSINTTFDKFKNIQERWRNAGNIPRDRYNLVWNNYHHHVENFYDFLHLNREFRDKDFKENLDKKLKLVEQAEELAKAQDVTRSFKELQMLHKMWKEEIGPVAQEYREEIWEKFSAATKKIHDARQVYFDNREKIHEENLSKKEAVIEKIEQIAAESVKSHNAWQNQMKKVEALRDEFFQIGKVPRKKSDGMWKGFKKATRTFNRNKNAFYKDQKKEQYENLEKKMELVKIAEDNKDNEDMDTTVELMKKIQSDWKKIGHVPRKDSDKIWKRFKAACNHVFDKLHAEKNEALEEEKGNLKEKKELLTKVKETKMSGDRDADLKTINTIITEWKETGRVPFSQKGIERDFNKVLDTLFKDLDLGRKETEMIKYDNRIAAMADRDDERQIEKERYFISKKIDEVKADINQLENNLGFFQHVPDDNPMVKEVHKNIANHKKDLEIWKAKMSKIKTLS
ncbi:DUF349 domain-containing protein [Flavimarina sp. Hel_I_48]|uniref:DUF349 domain-containing protein n=1 Tax=Flavimarina sp. Hel_I_48 TaxID=1392488 RepID=UPI0005682596|nr:DUF349 domain-containing protein [Flavimarina sp. Hel_I_48]